MDIRNILYKEKLSYNDVVSLLMIDGGEEFDLLLSRASQIRDELFGNHILIRGIIEFSNYCEANCLYCGIRSSNNFIKRYRLDLDEILETAVEIYNAGIKTIVLQSGEDSGYDAEYINAIIKGIKRNLPAAVTLSIGERTFDEYKLWKEAGADRYLMKHETANENLYSILHGRQALNERVSHLKELKRLGFQSGSGNIVGLPYQSVGDIAQDIILCGELDVDMASFSPFLPAANTPFAHKESCDLNLLLKTMAVARIYLKNVHMPATSALATMAPNGRELGIKAGANVVMYSFTPARFKKDYLIYDNKKCIKENPADFVPALQSEYASFGFEPCFEIGHSLKAPETGVRNPEKQIQC